MSEHDRLRIMLVCAPARAGGLETVVQQLAAGLAARAHAIEVAVVLSTDDATSHPLVIALEAVGVTVHVIAVGDRSYREERRQIRLLMRRQRSQVLHTHGFRADVVDGSLARSIGATHVTTLHGFTARTWRGHLYEHLQVFAAARADAAIVVSQPIAKRVRERASRVHLLRNAIVPVAAALGRSDSRMHLGLPENGLVLGWVGRLSHEKGPDLFIEALRILGSKRDSSLDPLNVAIIGEGPMRSALFEAASTLPASIQLTLAGLIQGASRYMAAFDALVLTSRTEGTPMVVLEAMAAGVPVIATRVGGVPDVLDDECAYLALPSPSEIAGQISQFEANSQLRVTRAANARVRVQVNHEYSAWITAHEHVYCEALRRVGVGAGRRQARG